ncbi:hypothetical protein BDV26DRAFT_292614 [Aspergillus bertholletiae]|uniref:FAD-binding PCMH-type domain-containing protein n=1 Tax=Aspergillus bertholletiae TaxID=1226010 RepID=A0A5N7B8D9_9EURO|nr:hypothetical protein BDV26DRAFT_292614 [Aspergillus bertholletiae]
MKVFLAVILPAIATAKLQCHCQPSEPCWPSLTAWNQLNTSVDGNLQALRPIAAVCHNPDYDENACRALQSQRSNSSHLSNQPGALQWENWSAWPTHNEECYLETARDIPCGQGRIPPYAVIARSAAHIQSAVRFAAQYNIKVTIRNTGHSFMGRSSAPNSLQINVHNLDEIEIQDSFVPQVPGSIDSPSGIPAVTLGAGVQMHSAYTALNAKGITIPGGSSSTVGVVGGFLQGGGHGILGYKAGMASDNALQFTVVTANGSIVTANAYQNQDLFWALRGGGGGTWGVVVNATIRTYPDYPVTVAIIQYNTTSPGRRFWAGVEACHRHVVGINEQGATGYYYITPYASGSPGTSNSTYAAFQLYLYFVGQADTQAVQRALSTMLGDMRNATAAPLAVEVIAVPKITELLLYTFSGADSDGALVLLGSRLLSRSFFAQPYYAAARLSHTVSQLRLGPDEYIMGNIVAGGQVSKNRNIISSSLNPAWRDTAIHLLFTRIVSPRDSLADQEAVARKLTLEDMPLLESLEARPMAAYCNEANAYQPGFQSAFWGENYQRLLQVKQLVDPDNLFVSRLGVGSDMWDEDGICPLC